MNSVDEDNGDFVFKSATSPKTNDHSVNNNNYSTASNNSSTASINNTFTTNQTNQINTASSVKTNLRFPALDVFIAELKKETDAELANLGRERLEEFLKREKEADNERDGQISLPNVNSPNKRKEVDFDKIARELDEKEEAKLKEMKKAADLTWKEIKSDYERSLEQLHIEQSARLAQESQLQESLKASGSVFDRELFEKVVDKCGKGKGSAYGKEKMARFWEVLDKSQPVNSGLAKSPNKADDDKLLASLLGMH